MRTATLSSKGQIVLPTALRQARSWSPGTQFEVVDVAEGVLLKPLKAAPVFSATQLDDVFGMARYDGPALSVEAMDAAVQAEAARSR